MGDPRKLRKKYETPMHMWEKDRIETEKVLIKEYGLKTKKEIWKMGSLLRNFKDQVKKSIVATSDQSEKEKKQLSLKLKKLGIITPEQTLDVVLGLSLKDILDRRLQTIVVKKGLAISMNQSRQYITHEHIIVGDKKITSPSYIVPVAEEGSVSFIAKSNLSREDHPERVKVVEKAKKPKSAKPEGEDRRKQVRVMRKRR